jgi:HNH endonuclease
MAVLIKCNASDVTPENEFFSGKFLVEKRAQPVEGDEVFIWTSERPRDKSPGKGLELRGRLLSRRRFGTKLSVKVQISGRLPEAQLSMNHLAELGRKSNPAHNLHERLHKFRLRRIWNLDEDERKLLSETFESARRVTHHMYPAPQTEIRIRWNNKESDGWIDCLPMNLFSKVGAKAGFVHKCVGPLGERLDAKCDILVYEGYADLDYSAHKAFNLAREIFLGVTRIHFGTKGRQDIPLVEWSQAGTDKFTDLFPTISFVEDGPNSWDVDLLETNGSEGLLKLVSHLRRERDIKLVQRKKKSAQVDGKVICEVCKFDFEKRYGALGSGFCEVHHKRSLAEGERISSLDDLAILCSNCHRMIHKTNPMMGVEVFRQMHLREV